MKIIMPWRAIILFYTFILSINICDIFDYKCVVASIESSMAVNSLVDIPEGWSGLSNRVPAGAKLCEDWFRFDKRSSSRPSCLSGSKKSS